MRSLGRLGRGTALAIMVAGCGAPPGPGGAKPRGAGAVVSIEPAEATPLTVAAVPYDLPKATYWERVAMTLMVSLSADGQRHVDGQPVADDDALRAQLREGLTAHAELRLVVAADSQVKFSEVIRVMDLAKQAGVQNLAFAVKPSPKRPPGQREDGGSHARPLSPLNCVFPAAADKAKIDKATVMLRATVDPNGRVMQVKLVTDPGHDFGSAATQCVQAAKFQPALDANGSPVADEIVLRLRFLR